MSGEPAIRKVVKALQQRLQQVPQVQVHIDRSRADELLEADRPAIVIRVAEQAFDTPQGMYETVHSVAIDLDIYEESLTFESISARHAELIAAVVELIHSDRTLGGMVETLEERSATAEADDVPDLGCAVLTLEVEFKTPRGDFRTIIGQAGLIP